MKNVNVEPARRGTTPSGARSAFTPRAVTSIRTRPVVSVAGLALLLLAAACGDISVVGESVPTDVPGDPNDSMGADVTAADAANDTVQCTFGDDAACDDGDPCTRDECNTAGQCTHAPATDVCQIDGQCYANGAVASVNACKVCDISQSKTAWSNVVCAPDENPCTDDACDVDNGCAYAPDNTASCDDKLDCTTDDHCDNGACVATPCQCEDSTDCVDVVSPGPCERAICADGACAVEADPDAVGSSCDDGDACTTDDICGSGTCAGIPVDCSGIDVPCAEGVCLGGECTLSFQNVGAECTATDVCVVDATCDEGGNCQGGWDGASCGCSADSDCNDGLDCTEDTCVEGSCTSTVLAGGCKLLDKCFSPGDEHPFDACQVCDPTVSTTSFSPRPCADSDNCTIDTCSPVDGCLNTPVDTVLCECTEDVHCDDQNPCTDDSCGGDYVCQNVVDDTNPCDDGNPDSTGDACVNGECIATCGCASDADCAGNETACTKAICSACECLVVADDTKDGVSCDDNDACTVDETCAAGICGGGSALDCSSAGDGQCQVGTCDPVAGCQATPADDLTDCDDGDPCTVQDVCASGQCAGSPMDCSDLADQCHSAACDGGTCQTTVLTDMDCDDGNACTLGDTCAASGQCTGAWDDVNCGCDSDDDCTSESGACTTGRCNTETHACYAEPKTGESCDDGNACTSSDTCTDAGLCNGTPYSCSGLSCETSSCDGDGGCTIELQPGFCRVDGACYEAGANAPDNACAWCQPAQTNTAWTPRANDTPCDADGSGCTVGDACDAGQCVAGDAPDCSDGRGCTDDTCVSLSSNGYSCQNPPNGNGCLIGGACIGLGNPEPQNPCKVCAPTLSATSYTALPDDTSCDADGSGCTEADRCVSGFCQVGAQKSCDDGLACTADSCVSDGPQAATCQNQLQGGCIIDGQCVAEGAINPANPCEACRSAMSTSAWSAVDNGTACNADDNGCTQNDSCQAGTCTAGTAPNCSDGFACTTDTCNSTGPNGYTCQNPVATGCLIGGTCYADGAQKAGAPCQVCAAGTSKTSWSDAPNGTNCNADNNGCTQNDSCQAGACTAGANPSCGDGKSCTSDVCSSTGANSFSCSNPVATGCLIGNNCYADGESNPSNPCEVCDAAKSKSAWSDKPNGTSCNADNNGCTVNDSCQSGTCTAGDTPGCSDSLSCTTDSCSSTGPNSYTCTHSVSTGCLIGGTCYSSGQAHPSNSCQQCTPGSSNTSWSNKSNGTSCNADNNGCTQNDTCQAGTCTAGAAPNCNDSKSCTTDSCSSTGNNSYSCVNTISTGCLISGTCYSSGADRPGNACQQCTPSATKTGWTNKSNGTSCNADSNGCTVSDYCEAGSCIAGDTPSCSDGKSCTSDSCSSTGNNSYNCVNTISTGCLISGTCYASGANQPSNDCKSCQPSTSKTGWTNKSSTSSCDSGISCKPGICNGSGTCNAGPISSNSCYISNKCYTQFTENPVDECEWCNPNVSQTTWSESIGCSFCQGGKFCNSSAQCGSDGFCQNNQCNCF